MERRAISQRPTPKPRVEVGIISGVVLSLLLLLYRSSTPHWAIVGRVPGTEHFRNVDRHNVILDSATMTLRIDDSLTFINSRFIEDTIYRLVSNNPSLKHLVLMGSALNHIDSSALESLEAINHRLAESGVTLHLSEIKGPVMDRLNHTNLVRNLSGHIFLSQNEAFRKLGTLPMPGDCIKVAQPTSPETR